MKNLYFFLIFNKLRAIKSILNIFPSLTSRFLIFRDLIKFATKNLNKSFDLILAISILIPESVFWTHFLFFFIIFVAR